MCQFWQTYLGDSRWSVLVHYDPGDLQKSWSWRSVLDSVRLQSPIRTLPKKQLRLHMKGLTLLVSLGRLFPSIKAACMYYGVSYPTFSVRRRSGYSVEESLINFRKKLPPNSKSITLKGKKYLSIADACRKLGLPRARVNSRLARGASTRQAFKEIYTPWYFSFWRT